MIYFILELYCNAISLLFLCLCFIPAMQIETFLNLKGHRWLLQAYGIIEQRLFYANVVIYI
jgi:hypothetical protein